MRLEVNFFSDDDKMNFPIEIKLIIPRDELRRDNLETQLDEALTIARKMISNKLKQSFASKF